MKGLQEAVSSLQGATLVGVSSHINPDGDSVGSMLALAMVLNKMKKKVFASLPEPGQFPPQYHFLPGRDLCVAREDFSSEVDVFVALDCSNAERLGPLKEIAERSRLTVNVDHHEDNKHYADINLVDKEASSTSELVFKMIRFADWPMDAGIATCLYTGILTDTGRFQHRNTSPETFIIAAQLAEAGANIFEVAKEVYESQSLSYTRLLAKALLRIEMMREPGLIYSYITQDDLVETGAALPETEDLIDHLRAVRGAQMVALFKELPDGKVRVSLRSRDGIEVGPIARSMGGGGHARAAGYTSELDMESSIAGLMGMLRDIRG